MTGRADELTLEESREEAIADFVRKSLKCTICFEFSASPIHDCANGHIVCGICIPHIWNGNVCPSCQADLVPSGYAEKLTKDADIWIKCKNQSEGCSMLIQSTKLKLDHLAECDYRPIDCLAREHSELKVGNNTEDPQSFTLTRLYYHLKDMHNFELERLHKGSVTVEVSWNREVFDRKEDKFMMYSLRCFTFDICGFVLHMGIKQGTVFWWVTVLSGQEESEKYNCVTKILATEGKQSYSRVGITTRLPVLPIHKFKNFTDVAKTGLFASTNWAALQPFFDTQDLPNICTWNIRLQMFFARGLNSNEGHNA